MKNEINILSAEDASKQTDFILLSIRKENMQFAIDFVNNSASIINKNIKDGNYYARIPFDPELNPIILELIIELFRQKGYKLFCQHANNIVISWGSKTIY